MENKKTLVALALVALIGIVAGTFAYFTSSATLSNEFTTGTYSTSVTEEFVSPDNWTPGTTTSKKVNVTNNGNVEVAVRAKYTENWIAADGTTKLSGIRDEEKVAQFAIGSDWELATDGYYYYKGILTSGQTSSDFISSVTFNPNFELEEGTDIECTTTKENGKVTSSCTSLTTGYAGATYSLDITIETIQADKKWGYTVSTQDTALISFSVDGTEYQAKEGMTWGEWVESAYSPDTYWSDSYIVSTSFDDSYSYIVIDSTDGYVHVGEDTEIIEGKTYGFEAVAHFDFSIDDVQYITFDYERWDNWCNSVFNIKGLEIDGKFVVSKNNGVKQYVLYNGQPVLNAEYTSWGINYTLGDFPEDYVDRIVFEMIGFGGGYPIDALAGITFEEFLADYDGDYSEFLTIQDDGTILFVGEHIILDYETGKPINIKDEIKHDGYYFPE